MTEGRMEVLTISPSFVFLKKKRGDNKETICMKSQSLFSEKKKKNKKINK